MSDSQNSASIASTSLDKAEGAQHVEAAPVKGSGKKAPFFVKPGKNFGRRLGQSLKRWWPLHLFIIAAVTLIVVLPVVYVGYPNISQSDINSTGITVDGVGLADPMPNNILLSLNNTLTPQTNFRPTLDPFNATFRLSDSTLGPFTTVMFPQTHVRKPLTVNITDQRVDLSNMAAFEEYVRVAFASESYTIIVEGEPKLKLGALPKNSVTFNKTVAVPGLNGFKGISTDNITINTTATENNFHAITTIPNQSTSTLDIGNITYNTYVAPNQTYIGKTFINNLILVPGNNTIPLVASVMQMPTIAALGVRPACETGFVDVTLVPANVTHGGVELPYLVHGMGNITQSLPLGQAISAAAGGFVHYYCPPGV